MKQQTLLFLFQNNRKEILLAMKKRGFGEGKWNGAGGKVEEGETPLEAIIRETKEEVGVTVAPENLMHQGFVDFIFPESSGLKIHAEIYSAETWEGEPTETEEMRPQWYPIDAIPYENMWVDDKHWLPQFIEGKHTEATFFLSEDGSEILDMKMDVR